jgi:glutamate-ammonia-ligase adenylyltransferase
MQRLLNHSFKDRARAQREVKALTAHLPERVSNLLELMLMASPAPEQGLHYFTRLRERQPEAFERLTRSSAGLRCLVAIFTYSHFLSEELLEHPDWADSLLDTAALTRPAQPDDLRTRLIAELQPGVPDPLVLARFRRRQILRIVVRDVLGLGTLPEVTGELSALADVLVGVCYERIHRDLVARWGVPWSEDGGAEEGRRDERSPQKGSEAHFAVIALGKLGGQELNYSSDIDLMFLYSANGFTKGGPAAERISNKEFFKRAANQLTALLSTYTTQGMCYRVDLRLRPDGSLGELCISLEGASKYYEERGRDWELQMLIKARVAAGHRPTGRVLLDSVEPRTYSSTTLDFSAIEQLSATRLRLNEKLAARADRRRGGPRQHKLDVKLEPGGIRDIEFLVQCLQRLYGGAEPWVRHGGTLLALARLQDKGLLSGAEYGRLASAYQFLRHLEHRLQFDEDLQTHTLPQDPGALDLLARRMPGGGSAEWLSKELATHFSNVRQIYDRVVHSRADRAEITGQAPAGRHAANVVRSLEQRAPALFKVLSSAVSRERLRRGYQAFEHFLERISQDSARLERLDADAELTAGTLDLFEHSPYFGEELIRAPELLDDLARARVPIMEDEPAPAEAAELRRWYRREMLRIGAESIAGSRPIFDTLARTSELADAVVARAYEIAIQDVLATHPPSDAAYRPGGQMWVIALGRLGMREFDLSSDADLIFVLGDTSASELAFWTRVAERLVDLITAYTGAGMLFAVDTRLRPNGGSGPLVQSASTVLDYFGTVAEAWEGITYMKSRMVAGDAEGAEGFLRRLQEVDWQRYGLGGRSRADLRQMRMKLEKEQGQVHPLKAGRGGYYDIDFLLMYLRLKSAGVFYKVLNTPDRIEVLQNMGHLDSTAAHFLNEAATFYRALDHGLRVLSGHAGGKLPKSGAQLEALGALLARWTKIPLSDLPRVRAETRAMFDRFFG